MGKYLYKRKKSHLYQQLYVLKRIEKGLKRKNSGIVVTNIEWDIDESDIEEYGGKPNLPNEVEIPINVISDATNDDFSDDYADAISDYLSDTYAYTVKGFSIKGENE